MVNVNKSTEESNSEEGFGWYGKITENRLQIVLGEEIPRILDRVNSTVVENIYTDSAPFPRTAIESIRDSSVDTHEKIYSITVLIGEWASNQRIGSWAFGPGCSRLPDGSEYPPAVSELFSERIVLGITSTDNKSFIPLLDHAEEIVFQGKFDPKKHLSLKEFSKENSEHAAGETKRQIFQLDIAEVLVTSLSRVP